MEKLMNKKGIILFYLGVVICSYLYIWRVEKLEEVKQNEPLYVVMKVND
ncbi:MAG: hypothetical protein PHY26_03875 [Bacilli bacterium]|jgi:hypothetical protein|nr:hypothetical protein [Bacilli bacterium]